MENEVRNNLYNSIEALEDFQRAHRGWRYVQEETERLIGKTESVLKEFDGLVQDIEEELSIEAREGRALG